MEAAELGLILEGLELRGARRRPRWVPSALPLQPETHGIGNSDRMRTWATEVARGQRMTFRELEIKMRALEAAQDDAVAPGLYMVARLDGRGFQRLLRRRFEVPFDERLRDHMVATTETLMQASGFRVVYGYTQSDEISLLLQRDERSFGRKMRKLLSLLAGTASAAFSLRLGELACFDCRLVQLPTAELVAEYFHWRSEDAFRNACNAHCYWALRDKGISAAGAADMLEGLSMTAKSNLLARERGIRFRELPAWQKRGVGLYWERYETQRAHPGTGEPMAVTRQRIKVDMELPVKSRHLAFIRELIGAR